MSFAIVRVLKQALHLAPLTESVASPFEAVELTDGDLVKVTGAHDHEHHDRQDDRDRRDHDRRDHDRRDRDQRN
jgi:hypothetical protein